MKSHTFVNSGVPLPEMLKRFALIFLPIAIVFSLALTWTSRLYEQSQVEKIEANELRRVEVAREHILKDFEVAESDMRIIPLMPSLRSYLDNPTPELYEALANYLLVISREARHYDQVRYLDNSGQEVIRINYNQGRPVIVPHDQLQNKSGRYYFTDSIQLNRGEIFTSPLDLNIEQGALEVPYKPMIRFGTPVFDSAGNKKGVVILNYFGDELLRDFRAMMQEGNQHSSMLLDHNGYWLSATKHEDEWGFMLGNNERTFGHDFPTEWHTIAVTERGSLLTEHGLFVFTTAHPMLSEQHFPTSSISVAGPGQKVISGQERHWKIVSFVSRANLSGTTLYSQPGVQVTITVIYFLLALLTWITATFTLTRERAYSELSLFRKLLDKSSDAIEVIDPMTRKILDVNERACLELGYSREELLSMDIADLDPNFNQATQKMIEESFKKTGFARFEGTHRRKDGSTFPVEIRTELVKLDKLYGMTISRDITKRKQAEAQLAVESKHIKEINVQLVGMNNQLKQAQNQLLQSEKMAAIGVLSAGVAHEINNPIGYVNSNIGTLEKYLTDIFSIIDRYEAATSQLGADNPLMKELQLLKKQVDLNYIREDTKLLFSESHQGLERVRTIVLDLKEFSRTYISDQWVLADVQQGLESTLNVIWNELKYKCEIVKEYGDLPKIACLPSQLNQVFMNLLINAAQAIEVHGTITLRTGQDGARVWIEVSDTGSGIPPENIPHLFEPFFTTKPVGKGTGLGLSVSYSIVENHHGKIEVQSALGKGSTFRVWLPIQQPEVKETT